MKINGAKPARPRIRLSWDLTRHNEWLSLWSLETGRSIEERWGSYSKEGLSEEKRLGYDPAERDNWYNNPPESIWRQERGIEGVYHGVYFILKVRLFKRVTIRLSGNLPINGIENYF